MAKRRSAVSVSWHKASGQFVKWVGKSFGKGGKPRPKVFYLGTDEATAIGKAAALRAEWRALRASGAEAWPEPRHDAQPPAADAAQPSAKLPCPNAAASLMGGRGRATVP